LAGAAIYPSETAQSGASNEPAAALGGQALLPGRKYSENRVFAPGSAGLVKKI
jgi:hypothetical protein